LAWLEVTAFAVAGMRARRRTRSGNQDGAGNPRRRPDLSLAVPPGEGVRRSDAAIVAD